MASPSALFALLGGCAFSLAIAQSFGHFSPRAVLLAAVGVVLWTIGLAKSRATRSGDTLNLLRLVAWGVAACGVVVTWVVPPGYGLGGPRFNPYGLSAVHVVMTLIVASYLPELVKAGAPRPAVLRHRSAALFACAAAVGVWILYTLPQPDIDVFALHQQGAERLLALEPVYGNVAVVDTHTHKRIIDDYVYPPMNLILTTLAFPLTGDTRWASLVAILITAALVQRIARRRLGDGDLLPELLAAAFLVQPRAPFIVGQAWGDPLALPFVAGFALYADKHRDTLAAVLLGLLCATKQYMLVFGASALLLPRLGFRGACVAGATIAATLLPFAIWTPAELWEGLVTHHLQNPFRKDALSISALLLRWGAPPLPGWVGFLAIPPVLLAALRLPRRLDVAIAAPLLALTWFFLFGRQAFANYYYFVIGVSFVWAAVCVGEAESDRPTEPEGAH